MSDEVTQNAPTPTNPVGQSPFDPKQVESAVGSVVEQLQRGAATLQAANEAIASAPTSTPAAPAQAPLRPEDLDKTASEKGAGAAFSEYSNRVLAPMQMSNIATAAKLNRRVAMSDPSVGPLFKRYEQKVDAEIKKNGITDAYLAQNGYEGIVRSVAAEDPAYLEERAQARAVEIVEEQKKTTTPATPAPPTTPQPTAPAETVQTTPVTAPPKPPATTEQEIASIKVSDEDVALGAAMFGMTKSDIQKQRHEIASWETKLGSVGQSMVGGVPLCTLDEIGLGGKE